MVACFTVESFFFGEWGGLTDESGFRAVGLFLRKRSKSTLSGALRRAEKY